MAAPNPEPNAAPKPGQRSFVGRMEDQIVTDMTRLRPWLVAWWYVGFVLLIPAWVVNFLAAGSSPLVSGLTTQKELLLVYVLAVVSLSCWMMWMGARVLTRYGPVSGWKVKEDRVLKAFGSARARNVGAGSHDPIQLKERQATALLVVHGIGIQQRHQTMDSVVRGLTEGNPNPDDPFEISGECSLKAVPKELSEEDCQGQRLVSKAGTLDVYELYWAPMVEGLMKWTDVFTWAATLVGRLPRRVEMLFTGSRALPHYLEVPEKLTDLRAWVKQSHSMVRRKVGYTLLYLGYVTVVLGLVAFGGLWFWRSGMMLQSTPAVAQAAALNVLDELVAKPEVTAVVDSWTGLEADTRRDKIRAYFKKHVDDHPLTLFCQGCETWPKLRLAALLGSGVGVSTYLTATKDAVMANGLRSVVVLALLVSFVYWTSHSITVFVKSGSKSGSRYQRIADLKRDDAQAHRSKLRSAGRAVLGGGIYLALLSMAVLDVAWNRGVDGDTWLLSLTLMMVAGGTAYLAIYAGVRPFLTRYIADVPLQANPSAYSPGAKARKEINEKAVAMLAALLREYRAVVVLAHSQGTVVTYEMFHSYAKRLERQTEATPSDQQLPGLDKVKAYVTIGVALSKVQDLVQGYDDLSGRHRAINTRLFNTVGIEGVEAFYRASGPIRWYNYWYQSDLVANPIRDYMPVQEQKLDWYVSLFNPKSLWTHSDYWDCVEFYRLFTGGALQRAFREAK